MNLTQKIVSLLAAGIIVSPLAAEAKKPSALQRVMNEDVGALLGSRLPGEYSQQESQSPKREKRKTPYGRIRGFGSMGKIGITRLRPPKKKLRIFLPIVPGNMRYRPFCMDEVFDEFEPIVKRGCSAIQQKKSKTYKAEIAKCVEQVQDKCIEYLDGGKPKEVAKKYAACIGAELSKQSLTTGKNANIKMTPGSSFHNMERYCRLK